MDQNPKDPQLKDRIGTLLKTYAYKMEKDQDEVAQNLKNDLDELVSGGIATREQVTAALRWLGPHGWKSVLLKCDPFESMLTSAFDAFDANEYPR